jgi:nucleoside diphosphate kinase
MPKIIGKKDIDEIIEMYDREGFSWAEIGRRKGLSPKTVRRYYEMAKKQSTVADKEIEKKPIEAMLFCELEKGTSLINLVKKGFPYDVVKQAYEKFVELKEKDVIEINQKREELQSELELLRNATLQLREEIDELTKCKDSLKNEIKNSEEYLETLKGGIMILEIMYGPLAELDALRRKINELQEKVEMEKMRYLKQKRIADELEKKNFEIILKEYPLDRLMNLAYGKILYEI